VCDDALFPSSRDGGAQVPDPRRPLLRIDSECGRLYPPPDPHRPCLGPCLFLQGLRRPAPPTSQSCESLTLPRAPLHYHSTKHARTPRPERASAPLDSHFSWSRQIHNPGAIPALPSATMESDSDSDGMCVMLGGDGRVYGCGEGVDYAFRAWTAFVPLPPPPDREAAGVQAGVSVEELVRDALLAGAYTRPLFSST